MIAVPVSQKGTQLPEKRRRGRESYSGAALKGGYPKSRVYFIKAHINKLSEADLKWYIHRTHLKQVHGNPVTAVNL